MMTFFVSVSLSHSRLRCIEYSSQRWWYVREKLLEIQLIFLPIWENSCLLAPRWFFFQCTMVVGLGNKAFCFCMHCFLPFRDTLSKEKFLKEGLLLLLLYSAEDWLLEMRVPWEFQGGCIDGLDSCTGYASFMWVRGGCNLETFQNQIKEK